MISKSVLREKFIEEYGGSEEELEYYFSPGRVNLIGEHIDYNGGLVFPAALSIGVYGILKNRADNIIRLRSTNTEKEAIVDLSREIEYNSEDGWGNYPKGIIKYLLDKNINVRGCDILYHSNLPEGSGLSSSAALEVITGYMLMHNAGAPEINKVELALLSQTVENNFIKVNCGIMDQFSVAMGKKNNAVLLNCSSLEYEYVPFMLSDYSLVVINTKKKRELADSKYNERRAECDAALALIREHKSIDNLCEAELTDITSFITDPVIARRTRHVITENIRVKKAVEALKENDLVSFGALLKESHESLQMDYEVTGFELDTIANEANAALGCLGARMTGAGFGGCAIALVQNDHIEQFKENVGNKYKKATGLTAEFYVSVIEDGVKRI